MLARDTRFGAIKVALFDYQCPMDMCRILGRSDINAEGQLVVGFGEGGEAWLYQRVSVIIDELPSQETWAVKAIDSSRGDLIDIPPSRLEGHERFEVGLNFCPRIKTLPPVIERFDGTTFLQKRRIARAVLNVQETEFLQVNGKRLPLRRWDDPAPWDGIDRFTGEKEFTMLGYSRSPSITIEQVIPDRMYITSLVSEVTI